MEVIVRLRHNKNYSSTGSGSDHSGVAIRTKASSCVNSETGTTVPSLIKVGVLFHLITNSVFAKLYLKVFSLVSPIWSKSILAKSVDCIIAYVSKFLTYLFVLM